MIQLETRPSRTMLAASDNHGCLYIADPQYKVPAFNLHSGDNLTYPQKYQLTESPLDELKPDLLRYLYPIHPFAPINALEVAWSRLYQPLGWDTTRISQDLADYSYSADGEIRFPNLPFLEGLTSRIRQYSAYCDRIKRFSLNPREGLGIRLLSENGNPPVMVTTLLARDCASSYIDRLKKDKIWELLARDDLVPAILRRDSCAPVYFKGLADRLLMGIADRMEIPYKRAEDDFRISENLYPILKKYGGEHHSPFPPEQAWRQLGEDVPKQYNSDLVIRHESGLLKIARCSLD
jgi:hypothetical protein